MKIDFKRYVREKIVALWIIILGIAMSFAIPTWNVPDEYTHLSVIGNTISNEEFVHLIESSVGIQRGRVENSDEEIVNKQELANAMTKSPDYTRTQIMPRGVTFEIVKRLPATVGILFGLLLGLPTYWVLQLGEIAAVLFYAFICYQALKILPVKKEIMALFMLFPIVLQEASSVSYDAVVIPLVFYFISYILWMKFEKSEITIKDVLMVLLCWGLISYIKPPYVALILLVFILPLDKMHIRLWKVEINERVIRRWRIPMLVLAGVCLIVLVYHFRHNVWIQVVYGFMVEWRQALRLFYATVRTWAEYLVISSVGNFGWLSAPVTLFFAVAVYLVLAFFTVVNSDTQPEKWFRMWDRIVIWGTFLLLMWFTVISMANHTIMITLFGSEQVDATYQIRDAMYQIPYIGGLQGRYFVPFLCLFLIPFGQKKRVEEKTMSYAIVGIELYTVVYITTLILHRYWIG